MLVYVYGMDVRTHGRAQVVCVDKRSTGNQPSIHLVWHSGQRGRRVLVITSNAHRVWDIVWVVVPVQKDTRELWNSGRTLRGRPWLQDWQS